MKYLSLKYSAVFMILALVGCTADPALQDKNVAQDKAGDSAAIKAAGDEVSMNAPVVIPPGFNDRPPALGEMSAQNTINGLPALSPSMGLKVDSLFSAKVKDTGKRIERLENAHVDFRREYEQLKPAIIRLAAIENDLQTLMSELNGFVNAQNAPPPVSAPVEVAPPQIKDIADEPQLTADVAEAAAEPEPSPKPAPMTAADVVAASATLQNIRIGNHADKVRIVLDLDSKSDYSIDLNNDDRVMIISLPDTARQDALDAQGTFAQNPLLSSYAITQQGSASQLSVDLKRATRVKSKELLAAKTAQDNVRIIIDLAL